jgi:hypothetical protein
MMQAETEAVAVAEQPFHRPTLEQARELHYTTEQLEHRLDLTNKIVANLVLISRAVRRPGTSCPRSQFPGVHGLNENPEQSVNDALIDFAISMSTRRNLTPSQKAAVSARAVERYTPEARAAQEASRAKPRGTRRRACCH